MQHLALVGIGTGSPDHLTQGAIRALNAAQVILIPRKGETKADLADLRRAICADVVTNPAVRLVEFDLPERDPATPDYLQRVGDWHDAIARVWAGTLATLRPPVDRVALLVWGDPSLYDSTLRIAARLHPAPKVTVIPGITALQALTAAHAIPLNALAGPVTITTGRRLRESGWPPGATRLAVMLDGGCAFETLAAEGVTIWWGAYLGLPQQAIDHGPLVQAAARIAARRAALRAEHGWIMDCYLLARDDAA
ncbi:MAG: precorrin-6A synthase (deacetylating) [Paracoccaceae bacterium]|nr:MAG: precorrin-6A synthase (deacetylating) [Paracoccaceae bacterium]